MNENDEKDVVKTVTYNATPETWPQFRKQFLNYLVSKEIDYVVDFKEDTLVNAGNDDGELKRRTKSRKKDDAKVQGILMARVIGYSM